MTSPEHENGTERIAEVAAIKGWDDDVVIVNLQGDEPLIPQQLIEMTAASQMFLSGKAARAPSSRH